MIIIWLYLNLEDWFSTIYYLEVHYKTQFNVLRKHQEYQESPILKIQNF